MNYLRGAVNAISAPYQYYKELPPINPSTLTGAIDVIVIRRPKDNGDYELACSPFHVRFGKLQVLRPGEKQVNVSVNGKPIPFSMKIGDAGEAFFVFETDEDIPEDLVTSPLLSATTNENVEVETGRFGAKQSQDDGPVTAKSADESMQEPEFLDLDAPKTSSPTGSPQPVSSNPEAARSLPHIPMPDPNDPSAKADAASEPPPPDVEAPDVMYTDDVALDMAGYHSHQPHARDLSDETVTSESISPPASRSSHKAAIPFPSKLETSHLPSIHVRRSVSESPDELIPHSSHNILENNRTPMQEYSWEWGGFPTPSATKTHFMQPTPLKPGRSDAKGKSKALPEDDGVDDEPNELAHFLARSRSVPPELEGSPHTIRPQLPPVDADDLPHLRIDDRLPSPEVYGAGGQLTAQRDDPTKFQVWIENQIVNFELAVVDTADHHLFDGHDELGAARVFDENKVDYAHLMESAEIVQDERLVIRCAGGQCITRDDGSPLMDALQVWVAAAPKGYLTELPPTPAESLPVEEPLSDPESDSSKRATSEPPETTRKPTSRSWTRWWSRSQTTDMAAEPVRPELRNANTLDSAIPGKKPSIGSAGEALAATRGPFASAPPGTLHTQQRSTTMSMVDDSLSKAAMEAAAATARAQRKKFAKTLRLSSDQLKSLELMHGVNTITFSLYASAAPACTARIFVWDSTDQVVVSDIDGTITKSDGLGHFFTMIGRDWTHLGVAKLYTDITKNGYKIMYLTSRAIGQADSTRDYLKGVKQNDYQLPEGPVIMSPDRLMTSLHREVIMRKPEVFKMACLRDIQRLFGEMSRTPFYAGFGNRITDALSYRSVNVPSSRIFTIDSTGEVKMELLELAGYKSSYIHMTDLVDQMFPPIHRKWAAEFTDFNYWKPPMQEFQLPDLLLAPPSPALSARSDTSNQSTLARLRNFSLVGTRSANNVRLPSSAAANGGAAAHHAKSKSSHGGDGLQAGGVTRSAAQHLRQMSSLERLSSRLTGALSTSSSSTGARAGNGNSSGSNVPSPSGLASLRSNSSGSRSSQTFLDSDDEADIDLRKERRRRTSMTSMPGSLDDEMQFDMDDEEEDEEREGYDGEEDGEGEEGTEEDEVAAEEAFDEDFFATGEMKNVPFL